MAKIFNFELGIIRMLLSNSHYETLQIQKDASIYEIKRSFRELALKYHPDKNKSSDSKEKFLRIVEAYEILSDENSRKKYDMMFEINNNAKSYVPKYPNNWTPSADYKRYYSYNDIKNWYIPNSEIRGGMWDMGERQNKGMWKTTLLLFGSLAIVTVFIIVLSK